jgi:hypothetical protein
VGVLGFLVPLLAVGVAYALGRKHQSDKSIDPEDKAEADLRQTEREQEKARDKRDREQIQQDAVERERKQVVTIPKATGKDLTLEEYMAWKKKTQTQGNEPQSNLQEMVKDNLGKK